MRCRSLWSGWSPEAGARAITGSDGASQLFFVASHTGCRASVPAATAQCSSTTISSVTSVSVKQHSKLLLGIRENV
jgi:hypothetical protein